MFTALALLIAGCAREEPAPQLLELAVERGPQGIAVRARLDPPAPVHLQLAATARTLELLPGAPVGDVPGLVRFPLGERTAGGDLRAELVTRGEPRRTIGSLSVPGQDRRLADVIARLRRLDLAGLVSAAARAQAADPLPGAAHWRLVRAMAPHEADVAELASLLPRALSDPATPRAVAVGAYGAAARLMQLDAACAAIGIPYATRVEDALPPGFRPGLGEPFTAPHRTTARFGSTPRPFVPAASQDLLSMRELDVATSTVEVAVPPVGASAGVCAILLPVPDVAKSHQDNTFEVAVLPDGPVLQMRYPARSVHGPRPLPPLSHTVPARLLPRGARLRVTMSTLPGLRGAMGQVWLDRLELLHRPD